jgi:hypothetical protein
MKNFMGKDGFQWFVGVVEDRQDPKHLGRVRIRCLGYHTEDLVKLPTSDLPWAHSTLPTKDSKKGFQDYSNANYPKYTETDVNRLAVNEKTDGSESNPHSSLTIRRSDRDLAVGIAQIDGVFDGVAPIGNDLDVTSWDEPETSYNATYPRNHVYESEGGHLREMDDTPGAERIHERHTSGTGYEIGPDGSKISRVKQDNYNIITRNDYLHIQGTGRHTIDKGLRIRVNSKGGAGNNYNIEVGNGSNVNVEVNGGNINLTTLGSGQDAGDININASRNLNMQVGKNMNIGVSGTITETSAVKTQSTQGTHTQNAALHDVNGNRIDLN